MLIEIEYYKKDTKLWGGKTSFSELRRSIELAEAIHNEEEDNFVRILCDMIHFEEIETDEIPDLVYDRDVQGFYTPYRK